MPTATRGQTTPPILPMAVAIPTPVERTDVGYTCTEKNRVISREVLSVELLMRVQKYFPVLYSAARLVLFRNFEAENSKLELVFNSSYLHFDYFVKWTLQLEE